MEVCSWLLRFWRKLYFVFVSFLVLPELAGLGIRLQSRLPRILSRIIRVTIFSENQIRVCQLILLLVFSPIMGAKICVSKNLWLESHIGFTHFGMPLSRGGVRPSFCFGALVKLVIFESSQTCKSEVQKALVVQLHSELLFDV